VRYYQTPHLKALQEGVTTMLVMLILAKQVENDQLKSSILIA
jgi:hypothetical protein